MKEKQKKVIMSDNTIFDDVFKTMVTRIPGLVIPVINEIFNTDYSEDISFEQLRNEQYTKNGEIITDSIFKISNVIYHVECQRRKDSRMVIRMIEYDLSIALNSIVNDNNEYIMRLPKSCVIHLDTSEIEDELKINVITPDGYSFPYTTKVLKVQNYSKDEIFEKKLLMFLPFYIIRYQNQYEDIENDTNKYEAFIKDFEDINNRLGKITVQAEKSTIYSDLNKLIIRIADYMLSNSEKLKKGVDNAMGGTVLELESERIEKDVYIKVMSEKLNYSPEQIVQSYNNDYKDNRIPLTIERVESVINSQNNKK